jgi:Cysteine-rich CPCC
VELFQCPCCDFFTLDERAGYDICPVCFWEDDGTDLADPDGNSGPNHMSLRAGRENFRQLGACDLAMLPHVLPVSKRVTYRFEERHLG